MLLKGTQQAWCNFLLHHCLFLGVCVCVFAASNSLCLCCADRCQRHRGINNTTSSFTNNQFQFVTWLSCHRRDHNKPLWAGFPEQHRGQITRNQEEGDIPKYPDWMGGLVTLANTHYRELPGEGWGTLQHSEVYSPRGRNREAGKDKRREGFSSPFRNLPASMLSFPSLRLSR